MKRNQCFVELKSLNEDQDWEMGDTKLSSLLEKEVTQKCIKDSTLNLTKKLL